MQPVGVFGDDAAFVGLHIADNVPDDVGAVGKLGDFVVPFLDVVFAEMALSVLIERADVVGRKGFANGNQLNAASSSLRLRFGLGDLVLDGLKMGDKVGHSGILEVGWNR